jgi:hypothetical protein
VKAGNSGNPPIKTSTVKYRNINGGFTGAGGFNDAVKKESGAGLCLRGKWPVSPLFRQCRDL